MREVLVAWGRLPILALRAIVEIVMSVVRAIASLLGVRMPGPAAPLPLPEVTAGEVREDVREGAAKALQANARRPVYAPGYAVHAYASALPEARSDIDIGALTTEQKAWLLALSDAELGKLTKVGAAACQRAVDGRKCGVIGLPKPGQVTEADREEARESRIRAPLRERILARRAGTFALAV